MKNFKILSTMMGVCIIQALLLQPLAAQGYGGTLTFQGLDQHLMQSAAGRAMGGVTIGVKQDIGLMFQNPALLYSLDGIQVSLGAQSTSADLAQEQNYAPVRYYPNLSLLLEGLTGYIPDPDTSLVGFTAQDTVQRPFDEIGPDWDQSGSQHLPLQALLAVPVVRGGVKIVAGIGAVGYADLTHYYQNNNVLSPGILTQRPLPTFRPTDDNPIEVEWLQSVRSREGSINGYGFALAGNIEKYNLAVGFSGMILRGSSDDYERQVIRGNMTFFSNAFRLDSVYSRMTKIGTSDYSGSEFNFSSILTGRYVSVGFSVIPPVTLTRTFTTQVTTDTTGTPSSLTIQGEDKLKFPWRGTVGLSLTPRKNLTVGLEFEYRPYQSVHYMDVEGTEISPWLSASLFHIGAEYLVAPWLALRGGMREDAEVFEPAGSQLIGEPVTFNIYSAGVGIFFAGLRFNITYEYSNMTYEDSWASAISKNSEQRHTIISQLTYQIPWMP